MAKENKIDFIINILGNAKKDLETIRNEVSATNTAFNKLGNSMLNLDAMMNVASRVINVVSSSLSQCTAAWQEEEEAQAKLAAVMSNTMDASRDEVQSILDLAAAQQKLGVIGDEVQLAGAQELSTYLSKKESLEKLMPVMNDMLAQQYGLNASQESAAQIATMMGKVMDGQVGALSRYGYKFTEAQEQILKFGTEEQRAATLAEVVSESVGGVNEALAQTDAGKLKQASNNFGDLQERFGQFFEKLKVASLPLMDVLMGLAEKLMPLLDSLIQPFSDAVQWVVKQINQFAPLFKNVIPIVKLIWNGISEVGNSISKLSPFLAPVKDVFVNHLMPAIANIWDKVTKIVSSIIEFVAQSELIRDLWDGIMGAIGLLADVFSAAFSVLSWVWDNVLKPILDGIDEIYKGFKAAFNELLKPIKALWAFWQRITGNDAKLEIEEKVTTDDTDKTNDSSTQNSLIAAVNGSTNAATAPNSDTNSKATAVATGGTRNTQITINLGKFMDSMVFQGGYAENKQDIENHFREMFLRTVYAAQIS